MIIENLQRKMAAVFSQSELERIFVSVCAVCLKHFNEKKRQSWDQMPSFLLARLCNIKVCSVICRWQLQYNLGIIHGFLLCSVWYRLFEHETNSFFRMCLKESPKQLSSIPPTCGEYNSIGLCSTNSVQDKCVNVMNFQSVNTVSNVRVKLEEPVSDGEEPICGVSFQHDVRHEFSIDTAKDLMEPQNVSNILQAALPSESANHAKKKVLYRTRSRKAGRDVQNKSVEGHQQTNGICMANGSHKDPVEEDKVKQRLCEQLPDFRKNTKVKEGKLHVKSKRKLIQMKELCVAKNTKAGKMNTKRQKLSEKNKEKQQHEEFNVGTGEKQSFQCRFCLKTFTAQRFLQRHLNHFHPKEIAVRCEICGDLCKNEKCLQIHLKEKHSLQVSKAEELFPCDQCPKSFISQRGLSLHKEFVHSQEAPVSCNLCGLTLKNELYLKRHLKRSHSDSIICDICGAKFKSKLAFSSHLSAHEGIKSYFCELCGVGFVRKTSLRRHVKQHDDVSYSCDTCPSSYKTFGSLSLHMLQIHQRGSYFDNRLRSVEKFGYIVDRDAVNRHLSHQCVTCGKSLVGATCPEHPVNFALMFKCHRCELTAEHVDDLLAHLRDHDIGTSSSVACVSFECKVCSKKFPRKLYLNQHVKKNHPGASMTSMSISPATLTYSCQVCGKQFLQKQYLYVHMKQHLQPGTFACHLCDRKFTYKCNLKNHLTVHSEDKPFKCDICFKLFRRKEVLNSHRLVHNRNMSPFKCNICGKGLSRKQYLKKHYRTMHPEAQESAIKTVYACCF